MKYNIILEFLSYKNSGQTGQSKRRYEQFNSHEMLDHGNLWRMKGDKIHCSINFKFKLNKSFSFRLITCTQVIFSYLYIFDKFVALKMSFIYMCVVLEV